MAPPPYGGRFNALLKAVYLQLLLRPLFAVNKKQNKTKQKQKQKQIHVQICDLGHKP